MNIMLGNLTVDEIEKRAGVSFNDELKALLKNSHQNNASNIKEGEWHCFDMPFCIVCGGMKLARQIYGHLENDSTSFKETLQIALN